MKELKTSQIGACTLFSYIAEEFSGNDGKKSKNNSSLLHSEIVRGSHFDDHMTCQFIFIIM